MVTKKNTNKTHNSNASTTGQPAIAPNNRQVYLCSVSLRQIIGLVEQAQKQLERLEKQLGRVGKQLERVMELTAQLEKEQRQNNVPPTTWSSRSFLDIQNHKHMQNNNIKRIGQSSKCFCGICFDFKTNSDMFRGSTCNHHPFCADCISKHVAAQVNKNVVKVNCPNPNCLVELKPEHLQPILPKEVIFRWESARHESSIARWQKTYCPFKKYCVLLVNDGGNVGTNAEFPSCHRLFCAQCKVPWHAGMNCEEFQALERGKDEKYLDRKFMELAKSEMWQRCPKCSIYVQRSGGCEHIKCRCGCNFCYHCGKDWKFGHTCNKPRSA